MVDRLQMALFRCFVFSSPEIVRDESLVNSTGAHRLSANWSHLGCDRTAATASAGRKKKKLTTFFCSARMRLENAENTPHICKTYILLGLLRCCVWASWWLFCWSFLSFYFISFHTYIVSNNFYFKLVLFIPHTNAHATPQKSQEYGWNGRDRDWKRGREKEKSEA